MTDKIFDEYGNYDFPTDIKQNGLNTATSCRSVKMTEQEVINDMCKIIRDVSFIYNTVYLATQYRPNEPYLSQTEFIAQKLYENGYRKDKENKIE